MLNVFLFPGNLVCDLTGVARESEDRQVLRSFVNMIVWGVVAIAAALMVAN